MLAELRKELRSRLVTDRESDHCAKPSTSVDIPDQLDVASARTHLSVTELPTPEHNFIGYSHVYKLRDTKRRGGGVSMFIDSRINYQDRNDINIDIEYVDTLAIEIPKEELETNHNTVIISIYRPPSI